MELSTISKIIGVALSLDGKILYQAYAPARHVDLIDDLFKYNKEDWSSWMPDIVEGFIDESGKFLNRKEAKHRAIKTGQYKPFCDFHVNCEWCFSEDLW